MDVRIIGIIGSAAIELLKILVENEKKDSIDPVKVSE